MGTTLRRESWTALLGADPRAWLLACDEPAARWVTRIEHLLDAFCDHQDPSGRFMSYGTSRASSTPVWGALLCDTHAVTEVLVRYGRAQHPAVTQSLRRMVADLAPTRQGVAWPCLPDAATGFRGPGRRTDFCPQVTLEALRTWARLPECAQPEQALDAARTALRAWRVRADEKPYMFGHGRQFKTVKWPTFWYDVHWLLDTVGRYPRLWRGPEADSSRPPGHGRARRRPRRLQRRCRRHRDPAVVLPRVRRPLVRPEEAPLRLRDGATRRGAPPRR